ncbi:MAG: type II toxin-antitoxin system RelE/ParE family toxin [Proteobacteria bacterium]|jgi:mRNA interferase RelE/StbE|nr:type II toxin-antitoxin system RelE/ParE family toxin [Pseudomonadota bacterium]
MAKYSVFILPTAQKEILALPKPARERVMKVIVSLEQNPRPSSCKKLVGTDAWRVRVGEYRIVYSIEDKVLQIEVVRVAHRKDVYR